MSNKNTKKPAAILFVVPWDQELSGVGQVTGNLARYLENRGNTVLFFQPGETNLLRKKRTQWGFPAFELNLRKVFFRTRPVRTFAAFLIFLPSTLYQLVRLIKKERIQVINIHYPLDSFLYFGICRLILPISLVTSVHGSDFFPEARQKARYSISTRFLLSVSDRIVAPSQGFLKDLLELFPSVERKATFIHNGISPAELQQGPNDNTIARRDRYILCIAGHYRKKALDVLIHAFVWLNDIEPPVRLVLVGDGPVREELRNLTRALQIEDRVEFVGWKSRAEVARLLHECEIFVLPSRAESFGIVVIEAMACRKPVVASSVGGVGG